MQQDWAEIIREEEARGDWAPERMRERERNGLASEGGVRSGAESDLVRPLGVTLADFLAGTSTEIAWAVDRSIVEGSLVVALGRPESFKSMAMLQLGLSLAGGSRTWLGRELGPVRPFIYVTNEKSKASIAARLKVMKGALPPQSDVWVCYRECPSFEDRVTWNGVVERARSLDSPPFVVLDTLASLAGCAFDENSGKAMAAVLDSVTRLTDVGATVALVHHPAKNAEGPASTRIRGHGSLAGLM